MPNVLFTRQGQAITERQIENTHKSAFYTLGLHLKYVGWMLVNVFNAAVPAEEREQLNHYTFSDASSSSVSLSVWTADSLASMETRTILQT